jgi:menaquinone-dependent protoporphyrinogen oxidase
VTVASRHGGTQEIGQAIATALSEAGVQADFVAPADVDRLHEYDGVVVGSAVYVGRWLEPARKFVERNADILTSKPVWLFSSGPLGDPARPVEESVDGPRLAKTVGARDHRTFAGSLQPEGLGLGERAMVRVVQAPYGDFRPWPEIRSWVEQIVGQLTSERS